MKHTLLIITLFLTLAIFPVNLFAQGSGAAKAEDKNKLLQQLSKEFADENHDAAIGSATKLLAMNLTPQNRNTVFFVRGRSLFHANFNNGKLRIDQSKPFKHSEEEAQNLKLAISDLSEVINYFKQDPPTEKILVEQQNLAYSTTADAYLNLGQYFSHQPNDFAKAEEFFKLVLAKNTDPNWINLQLVYSLAGQYKFYEARELAKKVLFAINEKDFQSYLGKVVEAFDMMGEYQFAEAFSLEIAGIRKAANKPLKPIAEVINARRAAQKADLEFAIPATAMELNRKGAMLAITQQCDKAIPFLAKSLSVLENPTAARIGVYCSIFKKDYEAAWQTSNNLVDYDKNDVAALSFRGLLNGMQNDGVKAEADISKALSHFPELAAYYNALDNAKKIYQAQNKTNKVNEISVLEKKFAELGTELGKGDESDRIGDILDEDDAEASKKTTTKTEPTSKSESAPVQKITADDLDGDGIPNSEDLCPKDKGLLANKGCPGQDEPNPKPSPTETPMARKYENSHLTESDRKALSDCQFVFEDPGCAKFVGKTLSEIQGYFGQSDSYGDYYRLGIHFWYYNDHKLEEITFQGVAPNDKYSPFAGKPGKKIDWNASPEETIAQYGTPNKQNDMGSFGIDLTYGNVVFVFRNNKLINTVIKDFAAKTARENTTPKNELQTSKPTQENGEFEKGKLQLKNEKEFLALVKWDNENATSTNDSIKRQIDYGKGIGQSPRLTLAGIIRSLDVAIKGREERITKLESYLIGEKLPPQNLENARNLVNKIKELNKDYEGYREKYRNDLRNLR